MSMSFRGKVRDGRRHAVVGAVRGEHALVKWWRHLRRSGKIFVWRTVPRWVWIALLALGVGTAGFFLGHGKSGSGGGKSGSSQSSSSGGSSSGSSSASGGGQSGGSQSGAGSQSGSGGQSGGGGGQSSSGGQSGSGGGSQPQSVTLDPQQLQYAQLQMGTAYQTTLPTPLAVLGTVAPNINGQAQVSPRLPGKIIRVLVNVGQQVQAGQVVALVSSPDVFQAQAQYQDAVLKRAATGIALKRQLELVRYGYYGRQALEAARVNAAQVQGEITNDQAQAVSAETQVAQADAQANLTQKTYVRAQLLYQDELISRQGLQQAEADALAAEAALATAKSLLAAAVDRLRNARNRGGITERALVRQGRLFRSGAVASEQIAPYRAAFLLASHEVEAAIAQLHLLGAPVADESSAEGGLLPVRSPIAGQVSARMASVGESVAPGAPMLTVTNLRLVIVQLNVFQEDIAHLRPGLGASVASNTAPGRSYSGVISVIGTSLNPDTRTVPVYCAIKNPDRALRPGVYVSGTIYGAARTDTIAVPQYAVQIYNKGNVVFTPGAKPGEYTAQPVQVGETVHGMTQIKQGLKNGQPIVTTNAFVLKSEMIKNTLD